MGLCPPQAGVAPDLWAGAIRLLAAPLLVFSPAVARLRRATAGEKKIGLASREPGPKAPAYLPLRGGKAAGSRLKSVPADPCQKKESHPVAPGHGTLALTGVQNAATGFPTPFHTISHQITGFGHSSLVMCHSPFVIRRYDVTHPGKESKPLPQKTLRR